ncbi:DUF3108 domain-containing protein [Rhodoferax ferrireducens]|uniref:DUF3108 domain-containing protein n=1 Tax=Rhodoferax ferrireducens TaxID=192843 RepID=UPI001E65C470|nr:DUF3108 domain-containing protein [Rhodoferax ferrireducens]
MKKTPAGMVPLDGRSNPSRTIPLKVLLALTAAVLLAHLALLQATPMNLGLSQTGLPSAFITRSLAPVPVAQNAAKQPLTPAARPKRKAPAPARTTSPPPLGLHASSSEPAPAPPVLEQAERPDPSPSEIAAAQVEAAEAQVEAPPDTEQEALPPRPPRDRLMSVSAVTLPSSVRFKYQVETNKFPFSANAELLWKQNGEEYDARLEISAFGQARVQTSRGQLTPEGLAPLRFSDKFRSEVAAHFNRAQGKVTFSANTPDVPLLAGAQDRLSILIQLAAMIAGDPDHFPPATTIALQAIGPRDADTWLFTIGEKETLSLPGGQQATLKLVRNPRQEFDQKVELWLAPALGYLPVRIRITEPNGDFVDQKWLATEPQT